MTVTLHFHGAAGTVTGSCYRIEHAKWQFLVDCGLFQGNRTVRDLNYKPFPFDPTAIDFLLLTHAHIDHAGLIPKLYRSRYRGPIHASAATNGLLEYLLPDAASIQESETEREVKKRARRGEAAPEPLYSLADAQTALEHRIDQPFDTWIEPGPGVKARYWNAGHILGSASIELEIERPSDTPLRILFSGDIGPDQKAFHAAPQAPSDLDFVLLESTYGGRDRAPYTLAQRREGLAREITAALGRGGNLVIPAFAVERSQELLHDIGVLIKQGKIDPRVVFLDSPLASKVTGVFRHYASQFDDMELTADELFSDPRFRIVESVEESKQINAIRGGAIILSASGMADAGRIKHHLRNNLIRHNATVLFVGYQASGTLGQVIQSGAREVRIHGHLVPVRAQVRSISDYSAHADHGELVAWAKARLPVHGAIFLTHGEEAERVALRQALLGLGLASDQVISPLIDDYVELAVARGVPQLAAEARRIDPHQVAHDWHNSYAEFVIELSHSLRSAQTDAERQAIMDTLKRALEKAA
jgi:metallo-beta-lactamase family protein